MKYEQYQKKKRAKSRSRRQRRRRSKGGGDAGERVVSDKEGEEVFEVTVE